MKNQPWNILRFRGTGSWDSITHKSATDVIDNGVTPYCQNHASMAYQSSSRNRAQQQQAAAAKRMTKNSTGDKAT